MIGFKVSYNWYSISTADYLYSFFSAIAYTLENKKWGSRFPFIMNEFYNGQLEFKHIENALSELQIIQNEFKSISCDNAIFDNDNVFENKDIKHNTLELSKNLYEYFVTYNGENMIDVIIRIFKKAKELKTDIIITTLSDINNTLHWREKDSKKSTLNAHEFILKGNRNSIRIETELELINKDEADGAFKVQKKALDSFMKKHEFIKYGTTSYLRLNHLNVIEFVEIIKGKYGSKTFTINCALIPLTIYNNSLSFGLSWRLGELICNKDIWWDYANNKIAEISFQNVMQAMDEFLLPFLNACNDKMAIKKELLDKKKSCESYGGQLSNKQQKWLDSLEVENDYSSIVLDNIIRLKLPKKLLDIIKS